MAKTPLMAQYKEVKEKYRDCLLFYRLGDSVSYTQITQPTKA